jgi:hypothetical protein
MVANIADASAERARRPMEKRSGPPGLINQSHWDLTMKKFFALAVSALALTGIASAQGADSYNEGDFDVVAATAYVRVPLDVMGIRDMNLGTLERGMSEQGVEQTAQFKITGDEGDLIWVQVNGGEPIVLYALHDAAAAAAAADNPTTEGPDGYNNDVNGQPNQASSMITVTPELRYRFVDNDEEHALLWDLPTWTARNGYEDTQEDGITRGISGLPVGIGQVNVYVGGTFSTTEDQQRGAYEGEIELQSWYDEDWAPAI